MTTLFGRRRKIPELRARNCQMRTLGERLAVNTVIQGTAADIIKLAMVGAHRALRGRGPADAADPHDPRRAAVRGPAGGDGRASRARRARDGRAVGRPRPAARRRRRRRRDLAGGEVMDRTSAAILVVAAGTAIGAQAPINATLGRTSAPSRRRSSLRRRARRSCSRSSRSRAAASAGLRDIGDAPWWALLGGACGVAIVSASIVGVGHARRRRRDRRGRRRPADGVGRDRPASASSASRSRAAHGGKIAGIALLAVGVFLIVRE